MYWDKFEKHPCSDKRFVNDGILETLWYFPPGHRIKLDKSFS